MHTHTHTCTHTYTHTHTHTHAHIHTRTHTYTHTHTHTHTLTHTRHNTYYTQVVIHKYKHIIVIPISSNEYMYCLLGHTTGKGKVVSFNLPDVGEGINTVVVLEW